ncbi:MAG: NADH-quinone oxidoreductase subunit F, partial [Candidatus Bathyarchaeia archaeon]
YTVYEFLLRRGDPDAVIQRLDASGLRGFGGAGFKTGLKWRLVHEAKGSEKIVICNAEEGEPGTFKDRSLLIQDPHSVLEGLFIAAWTVGASRAYVYLRQEYAEARMILNDCLKQLQRSRLVGRNIRGSGFNLCIRIVEAAGSYVSGEESALLESMEGNRCEPRLRPPYPATHGYGGQPTLIQNVETLSCIPDILKDNPVRSQLSGRETNARQKLYSVSGSVKWPGVYKLPLGTTARQLIYEHAKGPQAGREVKAFFPGGVSSGFLPASHMDVPLDFEALNKVGCSLGTGGVIVVDERSCIFDVVENCLEFFARESCGKCTPCRMGTEQQLLILRAVKQGKAGPEHINLLKELGAVMNDASICGLGQTAYNPVRCALEFFQDEFLDHLHGRCAVGSCQAEAR